MKALVSLSGGMDSTATLAAAIRKHGRDVRAVGFFYGSKHNPFENEAAMAIADHYGIDFRLRDISRVFEGFPSALMPGGTVPEGYYEAENMRQTVVPGRNLIFISHLVGLAQAHGLKEVWLGIHSGDHFIYPDCRPTFFYPLRDAVRDAYEVELVAPFLYGDKESIIDEGVTLDVPFHLTRTCYKAQKIACGKCGSCQERLDAFAKNGIVDPIEYESRVLIPKV